MFKTLSELTVGDVIIDPQGKEHTVVEPLRHVVAQGDAFYPAFKHPVEGSAITVEYFSEVCGKMFRETREVFPAACVESPRFRVRKTGDL